ncbi:hypothetical protein LS73_002940 [Helicobacter muridarum]|uniref:Cell division protein FtsX n=1 Tax=Helicobacter muridarum TaxID=216 RepID=A0A099U0Q1_9HELI|nr:FtsX-like permease family protein [Helicobacter muridarum]TLE00873.1 hypothetical protein LS73_002940 [Helicobacter muridarum]STQ86645.1 cell division protein FtsX [Helicobacter muridarum]
MNMLKQHFSLLVPLLTMLFSLQCLLILERTVAKQEQFITQKYAIGITSNKPITFESIQAKIPEAKNLSPLDPKDSLAKLTKDIKDSALLDLSKQLPYFYSLSLEYFPSIDRLNAISAVLKKNQDIIAVDTFSNQHSENYILLSFIKFSVVTFSVVLGFVSFMLMLKQIEIWRHISKEKMEIMDFLGASVWTRNRSLFKLAVIDSLISSFFIALLTFYIASMQATNDILESMGLNLNIFQIPFDFVKLFSIGLASSFFCVVFVIISKVRS